MVKRGLLSYLWPGAAPPARRAARVPNNIVVYAVGDIHGHVKLLRQLVGTIDTEARGREAAHRFLLFVGDYVDRGPDSRGVIEYVAAGISGFETICLKGNHEEVMLDFIQKPDLWDNWRRFGGIETLASYGVDKRLLEAAAASPFDVRDAFVEALPPHHYEFLRSLRRSYECGDYYFVHAGLRPGVRLDRQTEADQLWIREPFLNAGDAFDGRVIVHGHTPRPEPERHPFRTNIHTGAYYTGRLTAAKFFATDVEFLRS